MSRESYLSQLQNLLPVGAAWTRERTATLTVVLGLIAYELDRIHQRALKLIEEADPRSTLELLEEWELTAGLPDTCSGDLGSIQERRNALVQKITSRGGQSVAYYRGVAEALGYEITITEYRPFVCGISECGVGQVNHGQDVVSTVITDLDDIRFFWSLLVLGSRVTWFRAGESECGIDPMAKIDSAEDLECIFNRLKPAHTELIFGYEGS